jgi:hypothetical protein
MPRRTPSASRSHALYAHLYVKQVGKLAKAADGVLSVVLVYSVVWTAVGGLGSAPLVT